MDTIKTSHQGSATGSGLHEDVDRAAPAARPAVDSLAKSAHNAVDRIASVAAKAGESIGARSEHLKATQEKVMGSLRGYVREHPIATVSVALAAGYVLSRLLRSRH